MSQQLFLCASRSFNQRSWCKLILAALSILPDEYDSFGSVLGHVRVKTKHFHQVFPQDNLTTKPFLARIMWHRTRYFPWVNHLRFNSQLIKMVHTVTESIFRVDPLPLSKLIFNSLLLNVTSAVHGEQPSESRTRYAADLHYRIIISWALHWHSSHSRV